MSTDLRVQRVTDVETFFEISLTNKARILEALSAPGCGNHFVGGRALIEGNKPLAMIGDSVMKLLLMKPDYEASKIRGDIDRHVQRMANNSNLAEKGFAFGLDKFIFTHHGAQGVVSKGVMADAVEALIGAAYLDGGEAVALQIMGKLDLLD